jgi:regulator of cell morphogenesis and NO signaling
MEKQHTLDVRIMEPLRKHPFIFKNCDTLLHGEILTIVNDHDPLPLFYRLQSERPGMFAWEYLEQGPGIWKVTITKVSKPDETVADVLVRNPAAAAVLKKYRIDYSCQGNLPLETACLEAGIDPAEVTLEINLITDASAIHLRPGEWPLDFLMDYIVQNHHTYLRNSFPEINERLTAVEQQHGKAHPELSLIRGYYRLIAREVLSHIRQEEERLFPVIRELLHFARTGQNLAAFPFEPLSILIRNLTREHLRLRDDMIYIRQLSNGFTPPDEAPVMYRELYRKLAELEDDFCQHLHLENNILFPKALTLEEDLFQYP